MMNLGGVNVVMWEISVWDNGGACRFARRGCFPGRYFLVLLINLPDSVSMVLRWVRTTRVLMISLPLISARKEWVL